MLNPACKNRLLHSFDSRGEEESIAEEVRLLGNKGIDVAAQLGVAMSIGCKEAGSSTEGRNKPATPVKPTQDQQSPRLAVMRARSITQTHLW